jgi:two-component system, NtrC family, sensor histidine kinase HydH
MRGLSIRVPLAARIGAVAALFVAALATLWTTWASVVEREGRRTQAKSLLDQAGESLASRGKLVLASGRPRWPEYVNPNDREALEDRLADAATSALRSFDAVEGGYYVADLSRFMGAAFPTEPRKGSPARSSRHPSGPPPREADLIEIQVHATIRKNERLFVVEIVPPSTVAIRTAPVIVDGEVVAATWTMTRLVDPLFLDQSLRGYRLAAGLAVGGIAMSLLLTVGLARTVSRQKVERDRLQAELRRSERLAALGKLLAGVAHEVRNPLAGIRSTVQLWQRGLDPDGESFEDLLSEVDRLDGIVGRLLHFSRADAQEMFPSDLNILAAESARLATPSADSHDVRIELNLTPNLPAALMAPPAIVQVLRNLTSNAIQAMPEGGLLRISTRFDTACRKVEVEVADTGKGLTPEALEHLFEPFFTTKASGTGLGLAIAREIALAHHGDLRAGPRPGQAGASFTLALPVADRPSKPRRDADDDLA